MGRGRDESHNDLATIRKEVNEDPIGTGPYKMYFYNDQKITIVRDDNYWGRHSLASCRLPNISPMSSIKTMQRVIWHSRAVR